MKFTLKIVSIALVVIIAVIALVTCIGDVYNPDVSKKQVEYEQTFVQTFGKIAPDQDWGFGMVDTESVTTRGVYKHDMPEFYNNYILPKEVSPEEREIVLNWFSTHQNPESITIDWSDYTVQQVANNQNLEGFTYYGNMNQLMCGNDEINDYNHSEAGTSVTCRLVYNGNTKSFSYMSEGGNRQYDKYVIQCIDGSYYVGFDYAQQVNGGSESQQVKGDGYYNDWIIKVVPAKIKNYAKRIICEDLGATGDFDFNDVVFDALIKNGKTYIKLLAAGGTLPLTVAGVEVHEAFGVSTGTMVNTNGNTLEPIEFTVEQAYNTYLDIPIIVTTGASVFSSYELKATVGSAPQKIAVGTDYEWCEENQSIEVKHPKFKDYVGDPNLKDDWYK